MKYQDKVTVAILFSGVGLLIYLASASDTKVAYIPPPTTTNLASPPAVPYIHAPPKVTYIPTTPTVPSIAPKTAYAPPPRPMRIEAAVSNDGHGLFLHVAINNTSVVMQLDSGASHMIIPQWLAGKLMKDGSITKADFVRYGVFTMADGSERTQPVYRLRSVTVGGFTVRDVLCSVGADAETLLLGKNFLDRFSSWSVDNNRHVLVLTN